MGGPKAFVGLQVIHAAGEPPPYGGLGFVQPKDIEREMGVYSVVT